MTLPKIDRISLSAEQWAAIEEQQRQAGEVAAVVPIQAPEGAQAVNGVMRTAPARIWLNLFDTPVSTDDERLFPEDHEGITWAEDEVGDFDVQYVRADLAAVTPELLEIVRITIGNVRSLGPAGALAPVHTPYREWLAQLEAAYTKASGEQA
jgi:hypothetical protein